MGELRHMIKVVITHGFDKEDYDDILFFPNRIYWKMDSKKVVPSDPVPQMYIPPVDPIKSDVLTVNMFDISN